MVHADRIGFKEDILDLRELDAFILDMDGVVTDTARIHAIAWKQTFDEFLQRRSQLSGANFEPFDEKAAAAVLEQVGSWQQKLLGKYDTRLSTWQMNFT
jgi:beta-phosphoglucomutase-like phosphatase (HAD superfamily)